MKCGSVPGIDKPISRLVMGTMIINDNELERSVALLDAVYELGCTTFDTAHVYASERPLGRWVRERGIRDHVVIVDKGAHPKAGETRVHPVGIAEDLQESLDRLGLESIDLYLLHRDDLNVEVGVIIDALNEHQQAGRISAFGASNWTHDRIREANAYAAAHDLTPFAASSPNFSLAEQVESPWGPDCVTISGPKNVAVREWYAQTQMPVFAWSSLARGFFSGRLSRANRAGIADVLDESSVRAYGADQNFDRLDRAETLAKENGLTVPQIALAYVLNQPMNVFALIGAANREEFEANMQVLDLELTPAECAWLDLRSDTR